MSTKALADRIGSLKAHLKTENPELVPLLGAYEKMDGVLRRLRLMPKEESLASRISWWPVVSVVGLFSAGKSTSINDFLGVKVQKVGKQAVDDRFTVLCYGTEQRDLPGTALDVDSRFPFYGMGDAIEEVAPGEGKMIDRYLSLKTVPSERLRGLIMVDSPGFDSDDTRTSTLRLVEHIIDLSDLVLVYCDANKPEPGAMRDTLSLLVSKTHKRADANKFLYILNQIDVAAQNNNVEEIVAAWQRAVAGAGLTTGRFYTTYSESSRVAIADEAVAQRLKEMRDRDMAEIHKRVSELGSVRGYRVASGIEAVAKEIAEEAVPQVDAALARWRTRTNVLTGGGVAALGAATVGAGAALLGDPLAPLALASVAPDVAAAAAAVAVGLVHWQAGRFFAPRIARALPEKVGDFGLSVRAAFRASARFPACLRLAPIGWGGGRATIDRIREGVANQVRALNDRWATPTGDGKRGKRWRAA